MSWDRRIDFHIDVDAPAARTLITSETDTSTKNFTPELVAGDKAKVRLHFWRRGATPGSVEAVDPGSDATFRFSGRPEGVPSGSSLLFLATAFAEVGTGIWEATVDFHTEEMAAHIASNPAGAKTITCEVEVRDADDSNRRSIQFACRALPQVFDNQDAPTSLPSPPEWLFGTTAPATEETVTIGGDPTVSAVPVVFPTLYRDGSASGRPRYSDNPGGAADYILSWYDSSSPNGWLLEAGSEGGAWLAEVDVDTIDEIPDGSFVGVMGGGTPTLTHVDVSTAPPFFRVAGGYLYFLDENGAWVRTAYSSF